MARCLNSEQAGSLWDANRSLRDGPAIPGRSGPSTLARTKVDSPRTGPCRSAQRLGGSGCPTVTAPDISPFLSTPTRMGAQLALAVVTFLLVLLLCAFGAARYRRGREHRLARVR